jgi:hypothetical protein
MCFLSLRLLRLDERREIDAKHQNMKGWQLVHNDSPRSLREHYIQMKLSENIFTFIRPAQRLFFPAVP